MNEGNYTGHGILFIVDHLTYSNHIVSMNEGNYTGHGTFVQCRSPNIQ